MNSDRMLRLCLCFVLGAACAAAMRVAVRSSDDPRRDVRDELQSAAMVDDERTVVQRLRRARRDIATRESKLIADPAARASVASGVSSLADEDSYRRAVDELFDRWGASSLQRKLFGEIPIRPLGRGHEEHVERVHDERTFPALGQIDALKQLSTRNAVFPNPLVNGQFEVVAVRRRGEFWLTLGNEARVGSWPTDAVIRLLLQQHGVRLTDLAESRRAALRTLVEVELPSWHEEARRELWTILEAEIASGDSAVTLTPDVCDAAVLRDGRLYVFHAGEHPEIDAHVREVERLEQAIADLIENSF